jgi:O-glycosyl hydrolase
VSSSSVLSRCNVVGVAMMGRAFDFRGYGGSQSDGHAYYSSESTLRSLFATRSAEIPFSFTNLDIAGNEHLR